MLIKERKIALQVLVIFLLILVLAILVWFDIEKEADHEAFSGLDFCPKPASSSKLDSSTVFLLDYSDPITDEHMESVRYIANGLIEQMGEKEKLNVLFVNEKSYEEVLSICKPPLPPPRCGWNNSDSLGNWQCDAISTYGICGKEEEKLKRFCRYEKRVDDLGRKVINLSNEGSSMSPLIEGLSKISMRNDFPSKISRKIIMLSDLLQNTNKYSVYPDRGPFPEAESVMEKENIKLSGAKVTMYRIEREFLPTKATAVEQFWLKFFDLAGAETAIIPLSQASGMAKRNKPEGIGI